MSMQNNYSMFLNIQSYSWTLNFHKVVQQQS